jgi:predicted phosphodiesterase
MSKLKILAAGDFHSDTSLAKRLADQAEKEQVSLVILNGDIVEEDRIQGVIGPFVQKKQRVFMVPGNHETIATADFLA